jgi:hypothetical protein
VIFCCDLIVWLGWLFLRPFYSGKETKGGCFRDLRCFFLFTVQLGFPVKRLVGLYYLVSVLYGSVYGKSIFIFGGA